MNAPGSWRAARRRSRRDRMQSCCPLVLSRDQLCEVFIGSGLQEIDQQTCAVGGVVAGGLCGGLEVQPGEFEAEENEGLGGVPADLVVLGPEQLAEGQDRLA